MTIALNARCKKRFFFLLAFGQRLEIEIEVYLVIKNNFEEKY